jgi:alcohol dehydrogenase class IV
MTSVNLNASLVPSTLASLDQLGSPARIFVLCNKSSLPLIQPMLAALGDRVVGISTIQMGGAQPGLMSAADQAKAASPDCILTVGGGAQQDAGKLLRLYLAAPPHTGGATPESICAASASPAPLVPQICIPNSFAMAELTSVAGMTLSSGVKSGAAHPSLMPTVVLLDRGLMETLPDWVRFGTALRCVEHAVGAATHPNATEAIVEAALIGLGEAKRGIEMMAAGQAGGGGGEVDTYVGGWMAVRALNTSGCYPALGHLIGNM